MRQHQQPKLLPLTVGQNGSHQPELVSFKIGTQTKKLLTITAMAMEPDSGTE